MVGISSKEEEKTTTKECELTHRVHTGQTPNAPTEHNEMSTKKIRMNAKKKKIYIYMYT